MEFCKIGIYHCNLTNKYELARQASFQNNSVGVLELSSELNADQMLFGLKEGDRVWLLYQFDRNSSWKPMVYPPRGNKKIGVFATRSPYRPNPIGMSSMLVESIRGRKIFFSGGDLLDQTPILDIKPYISDYDAYLDCRPSWWDDETLHISLSLCFQKRLNLLPMDLQGKISNFIFEQLRFKKNLNNPSKRIIQKSKTEFILCFRTWRIGFVLENCFVKVLKLSSGYSEAELKDTEDPYDDKKIHKEFIQNNFLVEG